MKIFKNVKKSEWAELLARPTKSLVDVLVTVREILDEVRIRGDEAVKGYTKRFDQVTRASIRISEGELSLWGEKTPFELKEAILAASRNIEKFHSTQLTNEEVIETMPGVRCWRRSIPLNSVGIYVPGGTAPLYSTALMLGIPAKIAGVRRIALCTPLNKKGEVEAPIAFVANLLGIREVYGIGGAQAIGALAYGTESVGKVDKIVGPGNAYVTVAKELVSREGTPIDMAAGPSEVLIIADSGADPSYVAADLLSLVEHGADSQGILVSDSERLLTEVSKELALQLEDLPRKEISQKALSESRAFLVKDLDEAMELSNTYAPEHLILAVRDPAAIASKVQSAGSVFLGDLSPESVGDYASGTNHTLPTSGGARYQGGVSVDTFVKKVTFQELSRLGLTNIASTVTTMAYGEGLAAHARAVEVRIVGKGT